METGSINFNPAFGSKKIIRDADKVCRIIAKEFPAISGTRVETMDAVAKEDRFVKYCQIKLAQNRAIRDDAWKLFTKSEPLYFYQRFVDNMKKYKNINCADYTKLAQLILASNNIKAVKARILTQHFKNLDHAVLIVNPPGNNFIAHKNKNLEKMIIIDPWLGFADYGHNAVVRYNSEFSKYLGLKDNKFEKLIFISEHSPDISPNTVEYVRKNFPQFIQKSGFMALG